MVSRLWMSSLIFWGSGRAEPPSNNSHTASKTSLSCGIRSLQKIGGLFNSATDKFVMTDWTGSAMIHTVAPTFSPSPKDIVEFLFPSVSDNAMMSLDTQDGFKEPASDLTVLLSPTDDDMMAGNLDFCEVFTDLDDLLSMDAAQFIHQSTPAVEASFETISQLPAAPPPSLIPSISQLDVTMYNPDHSYSTIKHDAIKRKLHEMSNCGTEEDDEVVDVSVQVVKRSKYLERRKKNNIASKRSRETRKNKFVEMDVETQNLEKANEDLRKRIEQLESLTKQMKEALVARLSATASH